jgi:hypothetical protein
MNVLVHSNYGNKGIVRSRSARHNEGTNKLFAGDRLVDNKWYSGFQAKVERVKINFMQHDANNLMNLDMLNQVDLVYLSNIEYFSIDLWQRR